MPTSHHVVHCIRCILPIAVCVSISGCRLQVGQTVGRPDARDAEFPGVYIGQAECSWEEATRGGGRVTGTFTLPLEFVVGDDGSLTMDGQPFREGHEFSVAFGDITQTVRITGLVPSSSGFTWVARFESTFEEGEFDSTVRGALRFETDGGVVFQRTIIGVYDLIDGTKVDRIEQCRGFLTR